MIEIKKGLIFKSKHFSGVFEILNRYNDDEGDEIRVECTKGDSVWEETWDYQDTQWGFELGEYYIV